MAILDAHSMTGLPIAVEAVVGILTAGQAESVVAIVSR